MLPCNIIYHNIKRQSREDIVLLWNLYGIFVVDNGSATHSAFLGNETGVEVATFVFARGAEVEVATIATFVVDDVAEEEGECVEFFATGGCSDVLGVGNAVGVVDDCAGDDFAVECGCEKSDVVGETFGKQTDFVEAMDGRGVVAVAEQAGEEIPVSGVVGGWGYDDAGSKGFFEVAT